MRIMNKNLHAYAVYPVALNLIVMPFVFGLGSTVALAFWLSIVTGIAAFVLTLLTDHHLGVMRILPSKVWLELRWSWHPSFLGSPDL